MDTNSRKGIVWYRNDIRLHDHEALLDAVNHGIVYPIYVFDERLFKEKTPYGFRKIDVFRAQFLIASIIDLRDSLRAMGSDLIVKVGKPEEIIPSLAKELKTNWVFCNRERTPEELRVQDLLEQELWSIGQELRYSRGKMLYYTSDLPFPVTQSPDSFTQFRKEVEKFIQIREPLPTPTALRPMDDMVETGEIPTLLDLGYDHDDILRAENTAVKGGENNGIRQLNLFFDTLRGQKNMELPCDQRQDMGNSSRISAYLSLGCLSPKLVFQHIQKYGKNWRKVSATYELFMDLLWRDYHRLIGKKYGDAIFQKCGTLGKPQTGLGEDPAVFRIWAEGRTGVPIIDAAMTELNQTGYMPFQARKITASFLVHDLKINWQMGASYFESLLVDYDPCSNWGNWNIVAGVSVDTKDSKHSNVIHQAKKYDPTGVYVSRWIPALHKLIHHHIHEPFLLSAEEQDSLDFVLGRDYPNICTTIP